MKKKSMKTLKNQIWMKIKYKVLGEVYWQEGKTSDSLLATLVASASGHQGRVSTRQLALYICQTVYNSIFEIYNIN